MSPSRIGGLAGLLFALGVFVQNAFLLQGNPLPGAPLEEVLAFYQGSSGRVGLAVGWVAVNVPLLLTFGAQVARRIEGGQGEPGVRGLCAQVGWGGVLLLAAAFGCTTWLQAVLCARAEALAAAGQLALVWDLHSAAFGGSGIALGVTAGAFSAGAWSAGFVPRWTCVLGLVGTASLLVSGLLAAGTVAGGPGIFFQLGGFVTWLVWLLTGGLRLWREG